MKMNKNDEDEDDTSLKYFKKCLELELIRCSNLTIQTLTQKALLHEKHPIDIFDIVKRHFHNVILISFNKY